MRRCVYVLETLCMCVCVEDSVCLYVCVCLCWEQCVFVCWDMCMVRLFFSCPYAEYTGKAFRNSLAVGDVSIVLGGEGGGDYWRYGWGFLIPQNHCREYR